MVRLNAIHEIYGDVIPWMRAGLIFTGLPSGIGSPAMAGEFGVSFETQVDSLLIVDAKEFLLPVTGLVIGYR